MEIFEHLVNYELKSWMVFIIVILLGLVFILKDGFIALIKKIKFPSKKDKQVVLKIKDLKHHDLISTCDRVKNEINIMKFYTYKTFDLVKTKMCHDFATLKLDTCKEGFIKLTQRKLDNKSADELKQIILEVQNKICDDYIRDIKELWKSKNIKEEDIDYVIDIFEKFRYDIIKSFEYRINSIFGSSFHSDNFERLLAVFESWAMGIDLLPKDMKNTFEVINGRFSQIDY